MTKAKTPYLEGWVAYAKGKDRSQCPYAFDHTHALAEHTEMDKWVEGWLDARDANVPQRKSSRCKKRP